MANPITPWAQVAGDAPLAIIPPMTSAPSAPPAVQPMSAAGPAPVFAAAGPSVAPAPPPPLSPMQQQIANDQGQLEKMRTKQAHPWGSADNHPGTLGKIAHVLSVAGNITGDIFAPNVMARIPGTEMNTQMQEQGLTKQLGDEVTAESQNEGRDALTGKTQEETKEAPEKLAQGQQKLDDAQQKAAQQKALKLAAQGQIEVTGADGQTHIVDDPGSQVYQSKKALTDYHGAQTALDGARTELAQAGNDPTSPAYRLAEQRVATAQQNALAAGERASAYMLNAQGGNLGTYNGQALPGAMLDGNNQPVGSHFASNIRPTGAQRGKANMADSAQEQLTDIKGIMQKHANLFGPGYGQSSEFKKWVGSQDPDAQRFLTARTIAGDHLAATFGGRSEAALNALDKAIGEFKDNPQAAQAGIDQLLKANSVFQKAGHYKTVGGNNSDQHSQGAPSVGAVEGGFRFKGGNPAQQSSWEQVK